MSDDGITGAKEIERLWLIRAMTAIVGVVMSLGYLWMQNTYHDQRALRSEFITLQTTLGLVQSRQSDVRELNREQEVEIRALRIAVNDLRAEIARLNQVIGRPTIPPPTGER